MQQNKRILVLCTGNSARSQMAEGLIKQLFGREFTVESAGTQPSSVRPEAIAAMAEIGIDISENRSKSVDEFAGQRIEYVLTVCDNAQTNCPYFPAATRLIHRAFDDPADAAGGVDKRMNEFRRVREEIKAYLETDFLIDIIGA